MENDDLKVPPGTNKPVEWSEWYCELFGAGPTGISLNPRKGEEPNFFWRFMQYVCFGNKWKKRKQNG